MQITRRQVFAGLLGGLVAPAVMPRAAVPYAQWARDGLVTVTSGNMVQAVDKLASHFQTFPGILSRTMRDALHGKERIVEDERDVQHNRQILDRYRRRNDDRIVRCQGCGVDADTRPRQSRALADAENTMAGHAR